MGSYFFDEIEMGGGVKLKSIQISLKSIDLENRKKYRDTLITASPTCNDDSAGNNGFTGLQCHRKFLQSSSK